MNTFLLFMLIGAGIGLIIAPVVILIKNGIKNTFTKRGIKKLIKEGKFLTPIDIRDYDVKVWEKYINSSGSQKELAQLNIKIFKKPKIQEDNPFEDKKNEITDEFYEKAIGYLKKAKELGYTDDKIKLEFEKRNYPESLINKIFEDGRTNTTTTTT